MSSFKEGQRVILSNIKDYFDKYYEEYHHCRSNIVGNRGVVAQVLDGGLRVQWDNGSINDYHEDNLVPEPIIDNV